MNGYLNLELFRLSWQHYRETGQLPEDPRHRALIIELGRVAREMSATVQPDPDPWPEHWPKGIVATCTEAV